MRLYCLWCRKWLSGPDVCEVLPGGLLWPVGCALCIDCCPHAIHGIPTEPGSESRPGRQAA